MFSIQPFEEGVLHGPDQCKHLVVYSLASGQELPVYATNYLDFAEVVVRDMNELALAANYQEMAIVLSGVYSSIKNEPFTLNHPTSILSDVARRVVKIGGAF